METTNYTRLTLHERINKTNCLEGYEEVVRKALERAEKQEVVHFYPRTSPCVYIRSDSSVYMQLSVSLTTSGKLGRWRIKTKKK